MTVSINDWRAMLFLGEQAQIGADRANLIHKMADKVDNVEQLETVVRAMTDPDVLRNIAETTENSLREIGWMSPMDAERIVLARLDAINGTMTARGKQLEKVFAKIKQKLGQSDPELLVLLNKTLQLMEPAEESLEVPDGQQDSN